MKINIIILFLAIILTSCAGINNAPEEFTILKMVDYGFLNTDGEFYKRTTEINAKQKDTFGIKYKINGAPQGKRVALKFKVIHPSIKGKTSSSVNVNGYIGSWRTNLYTFDEDYQFVPGEWKMQVFEGNRMLLEKIFTVIL